MHSTRRFRRVAAVVHAATIGLCAANAMAGNISLTFAGIADPIDVTSYSLGASQSTSTSGGGTRGKVNYKYLALTLPESAASAQELLWTSRGFHADTATLRILSPVTAAPVSEWTLSPVQVTSFQIADTFDATATRRVTSITLDFATIAYRVFAADGSVTEKMCFDLVHNRAC